eukprot:PITA_27431
MTEEYESIMKSDVWDVVPRSQNKVVVTSKWLYKIKHVVDGSGEKYKVEEGPLLAKASTPSMVQTTNPLIHECKRELASEFEMKDVGLKVWHKPGEIFLSQGKYVMKILEIFGMLDVKPVTTLMELDFKKLRGSAARPVLQNATEYRQLVGALMFLVNSCLDICFTVNTLSQHMVERHHSHWFGPKSLLRYFRGTITHGLRYTAGDVRLLGKQKSVALSTVEAEYIAASMASCEAVWLRKLFSELFGFTLDTTVILCDNQSWIHLSENPVFHERSKHIDIMYHYIRDMVQRGAIRLQHIGTDEQVANILTKPLRKVKFLTF